MRPEKKSPRREHRGALVAVALGVLNVAAQSAPAQQPQMPENPVFVADSPVALEALARVNELVAAGNVDQAARQLQRLIDTEASALVPVEGDAALHVALRARVQDVLLAQPALLQRYRALFDASAEDLLGQGKLAQVERAFFLTPAGLTATVRLTHEQIDQARFNGALLMLAQLRAHPDAGKRSEVAAAAARLARYTRGELIESLCKQWGAAPEAPAAAAPDSAQRPVFSPLGGGQPGVLAGDRGPMVAKPLWSAAFGDEQALNGERGAMAVDTNDPLPPMARDLRSFPVATADIIYSASGRYISAFERLTLRPLWKADPLKAAGVEAEVNVDPDLRGRRAWRATPSAIEDISTVTVVDGLVLATPGADRSSGEEGAEQLVALDARTGELRWARRVDEYDPQLVRAHVRGAVLADEGTIVLSCRKWSPASRLSAVYLVGVDLYSVEPRWTAMVASAGSLPYMPNPHICDGGVIDGGVVYRVDRVGVMGAYEVGTGRPVWVRRYAPESSMDGSGQLGAWEMNVPVVVGGSVYVVTPNGASIDRLDRATGRITGTMPTAELGGASYVLRAGERLVVVSEGRVLVVPLDKFGDAGAMVSSERFAKPGIRGRVTVVGGRIAVPLVSGVALIDPANPAARARMIDLDNPGNVLVLDEQMVVADDARLHAYFDWTTADTALTRMIEKSPMDPAPPAALAEFAYRAGRSDRMIFAIDAARRAMATVPPGEALEAQRARLVQVLQTAIDQFQRPVAGAGGEHTAPPVPADQIATLIDRLGEMASGPTERAGHTLMLGLSQQRGGRLVEAIDTYQKVLADTQLAQSAWDPRGVGTQAGGEATRRIEAIVREHGVPVYASFEKQAIDAAAKLPTDPPLGEIESLARRYPLASVSPSLWLRVASAYQQQGLPRAEARALELGLQSAARLPKPPAAAGELAGRLVENLRKRDLLAAAGDTLRHIQATFPGIGLTVSGVALDTDQLRKMMAQELAGQRRWPRVGVPTASAALPQKLVGWALMEPQIVPSRGYNPWYLAMQHEDGRVAIFGRKPGEPGAESEPLQQLWTSKGDVRATLLKADQRAALFWVQTETSGLLSRVDPVAGAVAWKSEPFAAYFPAQPRPPTREGRFEGYVQVAGLGYRPAGEVVVTTDDHSVAMVERTGRCVLLDADSGQQLWTANLAIHRVFDSDMIGGQLIVAGERDMRGPGGALIGATPVVLVIDARTGAVQREITPVGGPVRRVVFTERGDLILLLSTSVMCADPENGQPVWRIAQQPTAAAVEAGVLGERLLLMAEDRTLWQAGLADGQVAPGPLESRGRLDAASIQAFTTATGATAFTTSQGALIFDHAGALVGVDALHPADNLLPAAMSERAVMMLATSGVPSRNAKDGEIYTLYAVGAENGALVASAPLLLGAVPQRLALMDGRVAVTAGHTTVIYPAPADAR